MRVWGAVALLVLWLIGMVVLAPRQNPVSAVQEDLRSAVQTGCRSGLWGDTCRGSGDPPGNAAPASPGEGSGVRSSDSVNREGGKY